MKIAVTSRGAELDSEVDPRFGRARYFVIVDTDTGESRAVDNEQNLNAAQGAGIQAAQLVATQGVEALLMRSKPEYGICHGDLHGGDVSYDDEDQPTLYDFDSSGCGWRALDIGVFLASDSWMDTSVEAEERRQAKLEVFLTGYQTQRVISDAEREAIQLTPAIRHIFLMGHVLRYTTQIQGSHWADDGFIDWHMTWFNHWAGQHL